MNNNTIKNIEKTDNFTKITNDLNLGNNYIDYFLTIGIEPLKCLKNFLYKISICSFNERYKKKLIPKILSKYPPIKKSYVNIDNMIVDICFPKGIEIKKMKINKDFEFCTFLLDNYYYSLEFPHKYVTCLLFYENLEKYFNLKEQLEKIEKFNRKENFYDKMKLNFDEIKSSFKKQKSENLFSLQQKTKNKKMKYYYIPKILCLVSVHPFFEEHKKILCNIYKYTLKKNLTIPIEKIIMNLVCEIPIPPKGLLKLNYHFFDEKIILCQNKINTLININEEIKLIFHTFKVQQILEIFKYILYELKIIFFSEQKDILCPIIYGFINLIYPFSYNFQVNSFLPSNSYILLESISPFIFGINKEYKGNFFRDYNLNINELELIIIDIDQCNIYNLYNDKFPELPDMPLKKLTDYIMINLEKQMKNNYNFNLNEEKLSIRNIFFDFMINCFYKYSDYLNQDYYLNQQKVNTNLKNLFKTNEFINSFPVIDRPFYKKITETQMFSDFIFKRMIPKDVYDKIDILFFDENVIFKNKKLNRKNKSKINIKFLTTKEYDFKESNYYNITKIHELKQEQIEFYESEIIKYNAMKKGQIISQLKNTIYFNYPLFPSLLNETFFLCVPEIIKPPNFYSIIENINIDMVSKSHLNAVKIQFNEMENYILLNWIQLWGYTFYYQDIDEKEYRFIQLLQILERVTHHEIEIFNMLFEKISDNENLVIRLYEKLLSFNLNPSSYIYNIISKIINKKNRRKSKTKLFDNEINKKTKEEDFLNNFNKNIFRFRSFRSNLEKNVINSNKVEFFNNVLCTDCQEKIDLYNYCLITEELNKEYLWVKCPFCKHYVLPKIDVKLGNEINMNFDYLDSTSTLDSIVLYSPYILKLNIVKAVNNEMNKQLDVNEFRIKFTALFWNCVWYFNLMKLDYSLFLPYSDNIIGFNKNIKKNNIINENNLSNKVIYMYFINKDKIKKNKNNNSEKKLKKKRKKFKNKELKIINEYNILIPSYISLNPLYSLSMRNSMNSILKSNRNSTGFKRGHSFINVSDFKDNIVIKNDESSNKITLFKPIDIMYEDDEDELMIKKILFFKKSNSSKNLKNNKYIISLNDNNNENEKIMFYKRTLSEKNKIKNNYII